MFDQASCTRTAGTRSRFEYNATETADVWVRTVYVLGSLQLARLLPNTPITPSPLREFDLADHFRPHPMTPFHLGGA
jgi:hypothetical protein